VLVIPVLSNHQPLTTEPIAESVGAGWITETKGHEELPFIVPPAPAPDFVALSVEGHYVVAYGLEAGRW
jgi:hypothetical protein